MIWARKIWAFSPEPSLHLGQTKGIPFLGFITFPRRRRLKRRKGVYYGRKLRTLAAAYRRDHIPLETLTASVQGWVNHVRYGNTAGLRKAMLRSVSFTPSQEQNGE